MFALNAQQDGIEDQITYAIQLTIFAEHGMMPQASAKLVTMATFLTVENVSETQQANSQSLIPSALFGKIKHAKNVLIELTSTMEFVLKLMIIVKLGITTMENALHAIKDMI